MAKVQPHWNCRANLYVSRHTVEDGGFDQGRNERHVCPSAAIAAAAAAAAGILLQSMHCMPNSEEGRCCHCVRCRVVTCQCSLRVCWQTTVYAKGLLQTGVVEVLTACSVGSSPSRHDDTRGWHMVGRTMWITGTIWSDGC